MAGSETELKDRILAEIAAHVRVNGRTRWDLVRERPEFAHVIGKAAGAAGRRKFFRWVDTVCGGVKERDDGRGHPHEAGEFAAEVIDDAKARARVHAQKHIPAAPSPAYLARTGAAGDESINFLAVVHELMRDAMKIRTLSVKPDPEAPDGEKITNPHLFGQAFDKRLKLMDSALRVMQEIWDLRYQQQFYEAIEGIIVEEMAPFPEVQRRVIERLAELNKRRGMTMYADPYDG
jgi:hypothetical protein